MNRQYRSLTVILWFMLVVFAAGLHADIETTGTGRAPGDVPNARERALSDALRDAVRRGVGVDLLSSTKVDNFELEFDRIFAHAFGFVRSYRVIEQYLDQAGLYTVKVEATVGKGAPGRHDKLALMQLVRLKGSPRVMIRPEGFVDGVGKAAPLILGLFKELALETELEVMDSAAVTDSRNQRSRRDDFIGDHQTAELRRSDITASCDFVIKAGVAGSYVGEERIYGIPTRRFSISSDLSAVWPDTGQVIAQVTLPATDVNSNKGSTAQAAKDCLSRFLLGELPASREKSALTLLQRILVQWVTELDLGAKMQLEFKQIERDAFDRLAGALGETEGIGLVSVREYDRQLLSIVEVESRLEASQLKDEILRHIGDQFVLDRHGRHYLQFVRKEPVKVELVPSSASAPRPVMPNEKDTVDSTRDRPADADARPPPSTGGTSVTADEAGGSTRTPPAASLDEPAVPPWIWAVIGAGTMALLWGVFALGRKSGKVQ